MKHSRYSTLLRLLLALVALAGLLCWSAGVGDRFRVGLHIERIARTPFELNYDTRKVTSLQPEAARVGVVNGSTLESLNSATYTGLAQWAAVLNTAEPGDQIFVVLRRPDGKTTTAAVTLMPNQHRAGVLAGASETWQDFFLFDLLPLLCMAVGYWVVLVKPTDPNAWLLLLLLIFPQTLFTIRAGGWSIGSVQLLRTLYHHLLQTAAPYALLLFALYFPERSRIDVRLPWLKWAVLGSAFVCELIDLRQLYGEFYLAGNPAWLVRLEVGVVDRVENFVALACVVLYLLILFDKSRTASSADSRRRLRVLLAGTGIGLVALVLIFVLLPALGYSPNGPAGHLWLAYLGSTLFLLAPLTLAYVVLVQRAMDVQILLRQGTRYALARGTLIGVQAASGLLIAYFLLLPLLRRQQVPPFQMLAVLLLLGFVVALRVLLGRRVMTWLDRKFFREAYDSERVLGDLAMEVRRYTDTGPLLQTVARCVADTLHVSRIGMLLRDGAEFCLTEAAGDAPRSLTLPVTGSTIRRLSNTSTPAQLYREDPEAWYLLAGERERQILDRLGAEVLLALPGRERLMGVMALGPKLSEAAYSKSDLQLLQTLANQTGMALEISELAHSLAREAGERERANRELEIAREVQERLFPQSMPVLPGGSIAGHCRPALGVGGDYFDVFPLSDGRLGLAIGDVSGKGISAALLMASLRASLRGIALDNPRDFAKLMHKVNKLVYESSAANRYATFFFGALDPRTLMLECVNAGHNAPLILRRNGGAAPHVLRLEADGPVVGLLPFAPYAEQSLQLQPGDLLLAYTDGISEAMTHQEEEWGEARMVHAASSADGHSADAVLGAVFREADAFTAGAPQHDDMTVLVLKLDALAPRPA